MKDLLKLYPDMETWDEDEEDRLESIAAYFRRSFWLYGFLLISQQSETTRQRCAKEEENCGA